jgi:polyisoprenoid-binding protein YceI
MKRERLVNEGDSAARGARRRGAALAATGLVLVWLAAAGPARAASETFVIQPGEETNLIRFDSKATMESFYGVTRQVSGQVTLDPQALGDSIGVSVEVDLSTLDTGIGLRNQHMRENHLETDKYPKAVFHGGKVYDPSARRLTAGEPVTFEIEGTFDLHGVTRPLRSLVQMTLVEAEDGRPGLRITTYFPVKLADYQISRPRFLLLKLNEVQDVTFHVTAVKQAVEQQDE